MSQAIVLILTDNVQFSDIETCLAGRFDTSITINELDRPSAQVAGRDKFGVAVSYVTVRAWIDNDCGVVLPAAVVFEPVNEDWKTQRPKDD